MMLALTFGGCSDTQKSAEGENELAAEKAGTPARPRSASKEHPFVNSLGMEFVPVPGTDVLFCVWETRVKDYVAYANAHRVIPGVWPDHQYEGQNVAPREDCPVVYMSWEDAKAFCRWLSTKEGRKYRLPTDAEWSKAVGLEELSGGTPKDKDQKTRGVYVWGTQWPPPRGSGNYADATAKRSFSSMNVIEGYDDGYATTSPVGSFAPNSLGLYDLGGNVWEWCEDWYSRERKDRVLRGASWADYYGPDYL